MLSFPRPLFLVQMYCRNCCCSHLNSDRVTWWLRHLCASTAEVGGEDAPQDTTRDPAAVAAMAIPVIQALCLVGRVVSSARGESNRRCSEHLSLLQQGAQEVSQDDPIHEIARQCLQQQLQVHGKQQMGSFHVLRLRRRQEQGSGASLSSETTCDSHGYGPLQAASTESHQRQSFST